MNDRATETSPLQEQLGVLRRGVWIAVLTTVIVTLAALVYSVNQPRLYQTSAEVFLQDLGGGDLLSTGEEGGGDPERFLASQAELAGFPALVTQAVEASGVRGVTPAALLDRSTVTPDGESDLLTFSVSGGDPVETRRLATGYARGYVNYRLGVSSAAANRARREIGERLDQLRQGGRTTTELYTTLLERQDELRARTALQGSSAFLIRPATEVAQTQPRLWRNALIGVVLGLILGITLVFLRAALDTRVRSVDRIRDRLGLPLLGRLSAPPRRLRADDRLAMLEEPESVAAEPFQILATNLGFVNLDRGASTIVVTSALPQEGKSTTVANLAVALARSGRPVALIDLDLRRPYIHRLFGLGEPPGVTSVAVGQLSLEEALVSVPLDTRLVAADVDGVTDRGIGVQGSDNGVYDDHEGAVTATASDGTLEVLPAGPVPPNVAELLKSPLIDEILTRVEARADFVLIDAPPLLGLSDTIGLSTQVDAFLVVTRLNTLRRGSLNELARVLGDMPVAKLGFVATGADPGEGKAYGYGYSYGSPGRGRRLSGRRGRTRARERVKAPS